MTSALLALPFLLVIAVVVLGSMVFASHVKANGAHRVTWWFLTGQHLDGRHRSNRGWTKPGTRPLGDNTRVYVSRLARMPRLHHLGLRWAVLLVIPYTLYGLVAAPALTETVWLAALGSVALVVLARVARRVAHRYHHRHVVQPLAVALAGHLGISPAVVKQNLKLSPAYESAGPGDRVGVLRNLPDHWHGLLGDMQFMEELFSARLPVQLDLRWRLDRHPMRVELFCSSAPPPRVMAAEYAAYMATLGKGRYFLGIGANGVHTDWDTADEDPEAAINSRTRGGKTNLLSALIAQGLARGEEFWAVDPKRRSLLHFQGVPGFYLACNPGAPVEMVTLIRDFRAMLEIAIRDGDEDTHRTLVLEEMNSLQSQLDDWWIRVKEPGQRMMDNPAWRAVKDVIHMGAQYNHRVVVCGQDLKDKTMFGSRSQFGTVLMNRYTPRQWSYIVGTTPVPPSPRMKGRFWLVQGVDTELIQVVVGSTASGAANEQVWRTYALNGRDPVSVPRREYGCRYPARRLLALVPGRVPGAVPAIPQVLAGLPEAAAYLGISTNAFKLRRREHPVQGEFTSVVQGRRDPRPKPCWHRSTLDLWAAEFYPQQKRNAA